jgi:hypothetical protein
MDMNHEVKAAESNGPASQEGNLGFVAALP